MKIRSLFFLFIIVFLAGCKKNNDETKSNEFSINGINYILTKGFLADASIWIFSDGLTITSVDQNTGEPEIEGSGDLVVIREITGQNEIITGTYSFESTEGIVGINYNFINNTNDYAQWINEGQGLTKINITDLEYEIEMEGTLNDGKEISAYFKGIMINVIQ